MHDVPIRIAKYEVGPDCKDCLTVELTSINPERWAIRCHGECYDKSCDDFVYEPLPSNRCDNFLENCRFKTCSEAITIAKRKALSATPIACKLLAITWKDMQNGVVIEDVDE